MADPNSKPASGAGAQAIIDRLVDSNKAVQGVEESVLGALKAYSDTVRKKMDELVRIDVPSEGERRAAEQVREEVLQMTAQLIRELTKALPKSGPRD